MSAPPTRLREVGPGCYNLRAPFYLLGGLVNVGTHMTFVRLKSGAFVALSAVELDETAKREVNALTDNGARLEAVLATNPFHTVAFAPFYAMFPDAEYYGTPRHIRNIKAIPWTGSVADPAVQKKWQPELDIRIPAGAEFDDPKPESTNHFSGLVVYHRASKTLICDDAFTVHKDPNLLFRLALGQTPNSLGFHWSLPNQALHKTPDSAGQFYDWMLALVRDWDFDHLVSAHGDGVMAGGARDALKEALERFRPKLSAFAEKWGGSKL